MVSRMAWVFETRTGMDLPSMRTGSEEDPRQTAVSASRGD